MEFVKDSGYLKNRYWSEEGNAWKDYGSVQMPRFWRKQNGEYILRTIQREIPLPLDWPVEVNYLEAEAFCIV